MNPMVAEVNRLIGNLLAAGESVALPEVGTLKAVRRSARRLSKREVLPPLREVEFGSELQGKTLPEQLAAAAGCSLEQATEIYGRWLGHTREEQRLTIEGVGVLHHKTFQVDTAYDARLNPQGRKPMRMRRRGFDAMVALGIVAVLVAVGVALYGYHLYTQESVALSASETPTALATTEVVAEVVAEDVDTNATASENASETVSATTSAPAPAPAEVVVLTSAESTTTPIAPVEMHPSVMTMTSGRYYVVLGVFSSIENAERAAAQAAETDGTLRCGVFRFGNKWMVSPFESDDAEACNLFRRAHTDRFPDMWLYRAR